MTVPQSKWGGEPGWPSEYRVLLSCASHMIYADLMCDTVYGSQDEAYGFGYQMERANGYEFEVMRKSPDGRWLSRKHEEAIQVIRRRWQ